MARHLKKRGMCGNNKNGFIALISAIIISASLLVIISTESFGSFFGRFTILNSEYKERSRALAEACAETALLKLAENPSFSGNETIPVRTQSCNIRAIQIVGGEKIIETQGVFQHAYTNIRITVDAVTLSIHSWTEIHTL